MVRCYIRSFLLVLIRSGQERLKICYGFAFLGTVSYLCFCVSASVFRSRYRHRRVRIRRRGVLQRKNLADPALRNIILTFACFFNLFFVCLLLSKMFMNVEVENKILQFQGAGSGRVFSLKKTNRLQICTPRNPVPATDYQHRYVPSSPFCEKKSNSNPDPNPLFFFCL